MPNNGEIAPHNAHLEHIGNESIEEYKETARAITSPNLSSDLNKQDASGSKMARI